MVEQKELGLPVDSQFEHDPLGVGSDRGLGQPQTNK
jgi:hypothetical protein